MIVTFLVTVAAVIVGVIIGSLIWVRYVPDAAHDRFRQDIQDLRDDYGFLAERLPWTDRSRFVSPLAPKSDAVERMNTQTPRLMDAEQRRLNFKAHVIYLLINAPKMTPQIANELTEQIWNKMLEVTKGDWRDLS